MTIYSPDTINTTQNQDGQAPGSIVPLNLRKIVDSLGGLPLSANSPQTTTYTLQFSDRGALIMMNSSSALSGLVPTDASVNFDIGTLLHFCQLGTGVLTVAAVTPGTTTVQSSTGTFTARAQFSILSAWKIAANSWLLFGERT